MPDDPRPWGIQESAQFQADVLKFFGSTTAWDEIKESLDFALARSPLAFSEIPNTGYRAAIVATLPSRTVLFYLNMDDRVVVLDAVISDAE